MKKILLGIITLFISINVYAQNLTFDVCEKDNCDFKNIDDALTRAEDYSAYDTITIILKDDYVDYELESHDLNSKIIIKNREDKKLDLLEINGKNNCTIKLKNTFTFIDTYNNENGKIKFRNCTFTTEDFRSGKNLIELQGEFVLTNINIDGKDNWQDYLRTMDKNVSYDELNGIVFNNSKIKADGLNINNFINGIINNNSELTIKNSDISQNVYSIYDNLGDINLDFTKINSLVIGKNKKANLNITGTSEFINTIKFHNSEPSKYIEYKDFSNIILLNKSNYKFNLKSTKNLNINSDGVSLKRIFPTIDEIDYEKLTWSTKNKDVAVVENNLLVPMGVGSTDVTTKVNDNITYTVHVDVKDKSHTFIKVIIAFMILSLLIEFSKKRMTKDE